MTPGLRLSLVVNGARRELDVPGDRRLLDVLRTDLGLTGTKEGCEDGQCGTCTVLVDGKAARACRVAAAEVANARVVTIEGLGTPERPHPLQRAFVAADAVQCGFCTPGMIMSAAALQERHPRPTRPEIVRGLGSNLCRCTGYLAIMDAVEAAANGHDAVARTAAGMPAAEPGGGSGVPCGGAGQGDALDSATVTRVDALDKATGRTLYAADLIMDGMLHARAVRSPHPHARIVRIDAERARSVPGVVDVLTAAHVPGENNYGRRVKDQPVLAGDVVRQLGDPVALVVATSPEAADAGLAAVDVEYEILPAIRSADAALAEGAPSIHPAGNLVAEHRVHQGDIAVGFSLADIIVERTYTTPWNEHAYLEPDAALAYWDGDTLVVRTATQYSHYQRAEISRTMGLPSGRVRVVPTVVGGAFGGKTDISCQCLAALGACRTGRPVKIVYGRAESFESTTKRHPYRIRCRAGARLDGRFTALEVDMLADTGAYASFGPDLMIRTFGSAAGPYWWGNVDLHGRVAFTNNPTAGCMRGPGTTQVAFALESTVDLLAERLGIDPLELRERNRLREGDRLLSGQVLEREPAYRMTLDAIRPHWLEALERCEAEPRSGAVRRGVGVASIWYGIGGGGGGPVPGQDPALTVGRAPGRAAVELRDDGSVLVRTGAIDLGQGSTTAMRLIAARELGVAPSAVAVETGDTGSCPDAGASVGSRVTFLVGNAVRAAAVGLRDELVASAAELLGRRSEDLEPCDGEVRSRRGPSRRITFGEIARAWQAQRRPATFDATFDVDLPAFDPASRLGEPYAMFVTATQVAEVEVDTASGRVRVLRVVAAHDVGTPVFPPGVVGQVEGGIAMGLGFALLEDFVPGRTKGFRDYRIPRSRDVPDIVTLLVGDEEEAPELGLRGIAECSNMAVAPAVVNAIAHAIGRRVVDLPVRIESSVRDPGSSTRR